MPFLIHNRFREAIVSCEFVSGRMLTVNLQFASNQSVQTLMVAYNPMDDAIEEIKNQFYEELQKIIDDSKERIIMRPRRFQRQDWSAAG